MKPSDIKRARASLQTERARLVEERSRFEADRRAWDRERPRLVEALKMLTARFGSDDWSAGDNLADVLVRCLLDPLVARDDEHARALAEAQARIRSLLMDLERAPNRPVPAPVVLQALPVAASDGGHAGKVEAIERGGVMGYRGACGCGWRGPVTRRHPSDAAADAADHARNASRGGSGSRRSS